MLRAAVIGSWLLIGLALAAADSARAQSGAPEAGAPAPASLIDVWLSFPGLADVNWPYSYLRAAGSVARHRQLRDDLFTELRQLRWRLHDGGYPRYVRTVDRWREALATRRGARLPGLWSPAFLMAHPNQAPPRARVAALGACRLPDFVEVWDTDGVKRIPWRSGLRLSDVMAQDSALEPGRSDLMTVIDPLGHIDRYGVAAWNHADTELAPGVRVIGVLPLKGEAFEWIRDELTQLLAHTPSGQDCREVAVNAAAGSNSNAGDSGQ